MWEKSENANYFIIPPIFFFYKKFVSHWLLQSVALEQAGSVHEIVDFVLCKRSKLSNTHEMLHYTSQEQNELRENIDFI